MSFSNLQEKLTFCISNLVFVEEKILTKCIDNDSLAGSNQSTRVIDQFSTCDIWSEK